MGIGNMGLADFRHLHKTLLRGPVVVALVYTFFFLFPAVAGTPTTRAFPGNLPIAELSEEEAVWHALNRLGFGPRPGDVERVRQIGLERWIEQQLDSESIDDSVMDAHLECYPTLAMSSAQLLEKYPPPQLAARQAGLSPEEYRRLRSQKQQASPNREEGRMEGETADLRRRMQTGEPSQQMMLAGPQRILAELVAVKMTRAIYSERQLQELLVDFWFNHFNVFAGKGADRWLLTSYDRDVIRPHVLGKFKDLLVATAKSPAMLFYLDNWQSADPQAFERLQQQMTERRQRLGNRFGLLGAERMRRLPPAGQQQQGQVARRRGLNENYARELMELHTLGVDGGYSQQDVTEVARAFTGWTLRAPRRAPEFYFEARLHDPNPKGVLGRKIHAGGIKDGEEVLDLLAHHPSTAKFISLKLARRFVVDEPPPVLVERMAKTFQQTDGDLRAVLRTMIYSPEFWSRESYRAKIKKPLELVASAARALGAQGDNPLPLARWIAQIGEPLYQCQPPTGYSDKAEAWVSTGALLNRMNLALALAGGRIAGTRADLPALVSVTEDAPQALDDFLNAFLGDQVSPQTRETLAIKLGESANPASLELIAGLVLGSPEFQRK
ncbi:MAG: DUF1800 domain-containing protein [Acidobacteria bacterium]|nr:DUF1800 domain-containing protein [Acidobacteriota bacterium]